MKKVKRILSFVDNLLGKFRKFFVNTITALFLILIMVGFLGSLFESDEVETEDMVLYLELNGVIVDKAITRDDPFEEFEIFGGSTNQIQLEDIL